MTNSNYQQMNPQPHIVYGIHIPSWRATLARITCTDTPYTANAQPSDRSPTNRTLRPQTAVVDNQENEQCARARRHSVDSLVARRSSAVVGSTASRATVWLFREGTVRTPITRLPTAEDSVGRQPSLPSKGRRTMQKPVSDGAATRDTMGLTTPSPSAPHAGCNRFSHDSRQLGQLV